MHAFVFVYLCVCVCHLSSIYLINWHYLSSSRLISNNITSYILCVSYPISRHPISSHVIKFSSYFVLFHLILVHRNWSLLLSLALCLSYLPSLAVCAMIQNIRFYTDMWYTVIVAKRRHELKGEGKEGRKGRGKSSRNHCWFHLQHSIPITSTLPLLLLLRYFLFPWIFVNSHHPSSFSCTLPLFLLFRIILELISFMHHRTLVVTY